MKDIEEIAPDGTSIKGRMQDLVKATADDIKECANACDTYSKKKLVGLCTLSTYRSCPED